MTVRSRANRPVSVVVVTRDAKDSLRRCLEAIGRRTADAAHRLVVVDNGSRDGTARFLKRFAARTGALVIRHGRNLGKAAALNDAVRRAPAPWYAFVDDDAVVPEGWLGRLLDAARRRPAPAILGCRIVRPGGRIHSAELLFWMDGHGGGERDLGQRDYVRYCDAVAGTCLLVRADVFERVRFRESLGQQYEDADFCLQARELGFRVLYCGEVAVRHEHLGRQRPGRTRANFAYMNRRWGVPVFADSHPRDRLYARVWRSKQAGDWPAVARAALRLKAVDHVPAYAAWWAALALSRLGRGAEAARAAGDALSLRFLSDSLRARLELACERERALVAR